MSPQIYNTTSQFSSASSFHPYDKIKTKTPDIEHISTIIKDFLVLYSSHDYRYIHSTNEELEAAMRAEMSTRKLQSPRLEKTVHLAASLIELAFHGCSFEEKKNIALYNWFVIYIDDAVLVDPRPCTEFQHRFVCGVPQLDPVLDAFAAVLHKFSVSYPPLHANLILSATFEFVTASCVEPQLSARNAMCSKAFTMKGNGATRFPLFLRERTGLGLPGALMLFSPSQPTDFVVCFQALGDMTFWTAAVNDLLSFFKEQLAGETATFIHTRAAEEELAPLTVLAALKDELCAASCNIFRALAADPSAVETWRMFEYGVVAWHMENERYRLRELDNTL